MVLVLVVVQLVVEAVMAVVRSTDIRGMFFS